MARHFASEDGPEGHECEADDAPAFPLVHPCGWNGSRTIWRGQQRGKGTPMPVAVRARLQALRAALAARPVPPPAVPAAPLMLLPFNLPPLPR